MNVPLGVRHPDDFREIAKQLRERPSRDPMTTALAALFVRIAEIRTAIFVMQDAGFLQGRTVDAFYEEDALLSSITETVPREGTSS